MYAVLLERWTAVGGYSGSGSQGCYFLTCTAVHVKLNLSNVTCNGRKILCCNKQGVGIRNVKSI